MRFKIASAFLFLCILLGGCGKSEDVSAKPAPIPAEESSEDQAAGTDEETANDTAVTPQTGLTPHPDYPIPDMSPPELVNYINQLATRPPRGESEDEFLSDQVHRAQSRLIAADRIILTKGVNEDLMEAAVRAKLDALRILAMIDSQGLGKHFQPFVDALNEGDSEKYARIARISRFWFEVDKLAYAQTNDASALMAGLEKLLADETAGEAEFLAAQDASFVLNSRGYRDDATKALKSIGNRFKDDEKLGQEAQDLLEKTAFREQVIAAMSGQRSAVKELFISIRDLLQDREKLNLETLDNTLNAAQVLEFNGHFEEARRVFAAIKKAFASAEDQQLAQQAKMSVEFAEKRLAVVGQQVNIEGVHIDGSDFHWSELKGKVVLVDFWATTSAPWLESLPGLKAAYDRFHKEGFEVVGINVDRDRQAVYDYIRHDRLPWPTIIDDVAAGLDGNPNALRYGIRAVPFVMLVGRDGKVTDIHLRGHQLAQRIEELLAEPSSQSARKDDASDRK